MATNGESLVIAGERRHADANFNPATVARVQ